PTIIAFAARRHCQPVDAVERLCQDARRRRFPCPARPDKKIGVGQAILLDRILERASDVVLPDDIVERLGSVFAGENLVAHPKTPCAPAGCSIINSSNCITSLSRPRLNMKRWPLSGSTTNCRATFYIGSMSLVAAPRE